MQVIGKYGMEPWGKLKYSTLDSPAFALFPESLQRHEKSASRDALCHRPWHCDVYMNGARVSDDRFTPGWTDYTKRVHYRTYDVTKRLKSATNAVGAILADGWYSGYIGWGQKRDHYGTKPRFARNCNSITTMAQ